MVAVPLQSAATLCSNASLSGTYGFLHSGTDDAKRFGNHGALLFSVFACVRPIWPGARHPIH
jgi:hypothetical protein